LFFGNVAQLTDTIKDALKEKKDLAESPIVVIIDFTLVVGMDSSAAHAVAKLKKIIHRLFHVEISIFVTGSDRGGFPCEYALSKALSPEAVEQGVEAGIDWNDLMMATPPMDFDRQTSKTVARGSISVSPGTASFRAPRALILRADGRVCESLDDALKFAEDILVARENPSLDISTDCIDLDEYTTINMTLQEEKHLAEKFLNELLPPSDNTKASIGILLAFMVREEYTGNQSLWEKGSNSDSAKLLVCGELVSIIEDTGVFEQVKRGDIVGELGLVHGTHRLTTLLCASEKAVLYSCSQESWSKQPEN
jgi:SulP family sulfate permease